MGLRIDFLFTEQKNRSWGRGHLGAIFTRSCPPPSGTTVPLQQPCVTGMEGTWDIRAALSIPETGWCETQLMAFWDSPLGKRKKKDFCTQNLQQTR